MQMSHQDVRYAMFDQMMARAVCIHFSIHNMMLKSVLDNNFLTDFTISRM